MSSLVRLTCLIIAGVSLLGAGKPVLAADEPTFVIEFKDGAVTPTRLEVPAKARFRLELNNTGKTPAEFETRSPKWEKVLAPGSKSSLVIRTLDPGEYEFFDDFHPQAKGTLVAK